MARTDKTTDTPYKNSWADEMDTSKQPLERPKSWGEPVILIPNFTHLRMRGPSENIKETYHLFHG